MDSITITREALQAALLKWENEHRHGETRTYEETQALPPEQVAEEASHYLWGLLRSTQAAVAR